ncbi:MAG TPA: polysaccharide biosynthesis/export family protein [Gemmatimonadales bacterium]|nr:polysaccharide biosynthesis/export family protein [Gemmatimonadales bacterium]
MTVRVTVRRAAHGACLALGLAVLATTAAAQQQPDPWDFHDPAISRQQLVQVLARYQAAAASPAYSAELRAQARADVDTIQARLRDGDMRVGDRLRLRVAEQRDLSDSFTVTQGPSLVLPVVGIVPLVGVLRSELEDRITTAVDSVYRQAAVQVVLLTRIAITGGVVRAGFYALPRDALLEDAITAAGGLAVGASLAKAYVERGSAQLWPPDSVQVALRERRTIAVLDLQAGDRVVVPIVAPPNPGQTAQMLIYAAQLPIAFYALYQLVK